MPVKILNNCICLTKVRSLRIVFLLSYLKLLLVKKISDQSYKTLLQTPGGFTPDFCCYSIGCTCIVKYIS